MADAVALPARYEPFGNVHLEALASGLPVLTSAGRAVPRSSITGRTAGWSASPMRRRCALGLEPPSAT